MIQACYGCLEGIVGRESLLGLAWRGYINRVGFGRDVDHQAEVVSATIDPIDRGSSREARAIGGLDVARGVELNQGSRAALAARRTTGHADEGGDPRSMGCGIERSRKRSGYRGRGKARP